MKYIFLTVIFLVVGLLAYGQLKDKASIAAVLPQEIKYNPSPVLPKGMEIANIYENKDEKWWLARLKISANVKLMPHSHPDTRYVTVLSGTYYQGSGERFDEKSLTAYPPGTFLVVPAGVKHFVWAKDGETVVQESGATPTGITYVDPAHDPRNNSLK